MHQTLGIWFRACVISYVCVSVLGCATSSILKYAYESSSKEPKLWTIEDVSFAAIRDQRYVRLCVDLRHLSEEAPIELKLDLKQIAEQLQLQDTTVSSIEDRIKPVSSDKESEVCIKSVKKGEVILPVIVKRSEAADVKTALKELSYDISEEPAVFILQYQESRYILFGAPLDDYPDLATHAFGSYAQQQSDYKYYLFLPLGLAADAILIVFGGFVLILVTATCILLLPICLVGIAQTIGSTSDSADDGNELLPTDDDLLFE